MLRKTEVFSFIIMAFGLFIGVHQSCSKSDLAEIVPYIEIKGKPSVSEGGIEVTTRINNNSGQSIMKYGYIWSVPGKGYVSAHVVQADNFSDKEFKALIDYALPKDDSVSFQAFVETDNGQIIISLPKKTKARGGLPPVVDNLFPEKASVGDTLYIQGVRFPNRYIPTGHTYRNLTVKFNTTTARVVESYYNQIKVVIPYISTHMTNVFEITLSVLDEEFVVGQFEYDTGDQ